MLISKYHAPNALIIVVLLLVLSMATAQNCQANTFKTPYTRCTIQLARCVQDTLGPPQFRFNSCTMEHCSRLGAGQSECAQYITLNLDQTQCYRSCCRSSQFQPSKCLVNNQVLKSENKIADQYLFIVLGICAVVLVTVIGCFATRVIGCFQRRDPQVKKEKVVPVWRKHSYRDNKCTHCQQYGAVIQTPCQHYYHFACLKILTNQGPLTSNCPTCKTEMFKWRLWCSDCHQKCIKSITDEFESVQKLEAFYWQARILHNDCSMDMYCYAKTDLRLTCSTNE